MNLDKANPGFSERIKCSPIKKPLNPARQSEFTTDGFVMPLSETNTALVAALN
jgi:hypothetical protein